MTSIKRVGGYLAEITISEALEIVTCQWGRWVSEEDVTISKQNFKVVLYPSEDLGARNFVTWSLVLPYSFGNLP